MSRAHERSSWVFSGETARAAWGTLLLGALAAVILFLDLPASERLALLAAATLAATGLAGWRARRRSHQIAAVESEARELLRAGLAELDATVNVGADARGGAGGEFAGVAGALGDLAERFTEQLKEAAKKGRNLEALIDAIDEPLLVTDDKNHVLLCNRSAEMLFDAAPGTLAGRPFGELFTSREILQMHIAARAGEVRRGRARLTTPLGRRVLQVSASPVPAAWGEGVFGAVMFLRDVTELDQAVQVRTDFVANASHELRTPVSAIRGAAETLMDGAKDDPAMSDRLLKMIISHAGRLEEMLRDLLDLSRLESPDAPVEIGPVDTEELEATLSAMFEDICREKCLRLVLEFDDDLHGMRTDRRLLLLMLRNLIENATKFAYASTPIRVTGAAVELELPPERGEGGRTPLRGVARFEVIDRGIGIPLSQQERVFERYYQVDQARTGASGGRGTGLGLSIVKHAAKALGGSVGLTSVYKEGTTVWVELPCEFARDASAEARNTGEGGAAA